MGQCKQRYGAGCQHLQTSNFAIIGGAVCDMYLVFRCRLASLDGSCIPRRLCLLVE